MPSRIYEKLVKFKPKINFPDVAIEEQIYQQITALQKDNQTPKIPPVLYGQKFELHEHQRNALEKWKANSFQGIFSLATGAGKTITAIYGAIKLYDSGKKLFLVIAVPYQNLADQWAEILKLFGIFPIRCYKSKEIWQKELLNAVRSYNIRATNFCCVVVVNATLTSDTFQEIIGQITPFSIKTSLFIGDECHHHNSASYIRKLPLFALRMGLSATPYPENYEENINVVIDYYGPIVSSYSIDDALKYGVLAPYKYQIHPVYLTELETEEYIELSSKIAPLLAAAGQDRLANKDGLTALLIKRARLIGAATNKLSSLREILIGLTISPHSLFYCGDGHLEDPDDGTSARQIEHVSQVLHEHNWRTSRFTAKESLPVRRRILDGFKATTIDALVAIKVLDEGIDIPACRVAFLLASSRNPRQFIQRRGRILRKYPGKSHAIIHDFIVLPHPGMNQVKSARELVTKEIERAVEFLRLCSNKSEAHQVLDPLAEKLDLLHMTTYSTV